MIEQEKDEKIEQEPVELQDEEVEEVAGGKKPVYGGSGGGVKFE